MFCVLHTLQQSSKNDLSREGLISQWLQNFADMVGLFYQQYHEAELTAFLEFIILQLKAKNQAEKFTIVSKILIEITSWKKYQIDEMNIGQRNSMSAGWQLKQETYDFRIKRNRPSLENLEKALFTAENKPSVAYLIQIYLQKCYNYVAFE